MNSNLKNEFNSSPLCLRTKVKEQRALKVKSFTSFVFSASARPSPCLGTFLSRKTQFCSPWLCHSLIPTHCSEARVASECVKRWGWSAGQLPMLRHLRVCFWWSWCRWWHRLSWGWGRTHTSVGEDEERVRICSTMPNNTTFNRLRNKMMTH